MLIDGCTLLDGLALLGKDDQVMDLECCVIFDDFFQRRTPAPIYLSIVSARLRSIDHQTVFHHVHRYANNHRSLSESGPRTNQFHLYNWLVQAVKQCRQCFNHEQLDQSSMCQIMVPIYSQA